MKRPPSLQLFDAREEGKGTGMAYGHVSLTTPVIATGALEAIVTPATPVTPVVGEPAAPVNASAPKVIG
ncbi:MAG TPA: hypothetical protein VMF13_17260 [Luteitalea sp.]|nr:hypothetical protein [Luteitalea sp.]